MPKLLSNLSEVRARGAHVIAVASAGSTEVGEHAEDVIYIPRTDPLPQVILAVAPLQLLAYHVARNSRAERRSAAQPCQDSHG